MEKKKSKKQNSYNLRNAQIKVNGYLIFLFSELPVGRFSEKPLPVTLGQSKVPPGSVSFLLTDQYWELRRRVGSSPTCTFVTWPEPRASLMGEGE